MMIKKWVKVAFAFMMALPLLTQAAVVTADAGGKLEIDYPSIAIGPGLFTEKWEYKGSSFDVSKLGQDGPYQFNISPFGKNEIEGSARFTKEGNGVVASYTFKAKSNITLNTLFTGATLSLEDFSGGSWNSGDKKGSFPAKYKNLMIMNERTRSLALTTKAGKTIQFNFPDDTHVMIQDNRQWSENYALRIGYINKINLKKGETRTIAFTVMPPGETVLKQQRPITLQAGKEWTPLKDELDIKKGSALDFSQLGFTDGPAGKYGRIIAKGPHFVFEKMPDKPQRFYGVNFCFSANYPEKETADAIARRLTRIGYNSVRIHHYESIMTSGSTDGTELNAESMRRFDIFTAALIREGIYLTTDLFVSRQVPWRAIGIDKPGNIPQETFKKLVPVHEGAYNNLRKYVSNWLGHVNPYTGRSYAKEPALAWINIINEGNFGNHYNEIKEIPEWREAWQKWLKEKKAAEPSIYNSIPDTIPRDVNMTKSDPHKAAFLLFFRDQEIIMMKRFRALLRDELGCKALISNANGWSHYVPDHFVRSQTYDYIDEHFYVDHPHFIQKRWRLPSRCPNTNPIKNSNYGCRPEIYMRHFDKPFTITEYNYCAPGRFRGVGGILTGTLAALQDWSGLWRFAYSHSGTALASMQSQPLNYFDILNDPMSLAAERASICLFLRGDIAPLKKTAVIHLPAERFNSLTEIYPSSKKLWAALGWSRKTGILTGGNPPEGYDNKTSFPDVFAQYNADKDVIPFVGGTVDELVKENQALSIDNKNGTFIIKTSRTCGGFTEQGVLNAGVLEFDVSGSAATVWVSSLDGLPIKSSQRMILTHLTDIQNTGIRYAEEQRRTLLKWGGLPHLVRSGTAEIRLNIDNPGSFKVYALSTGGRRIATIPSKVSNGSLKFTAKTFADRSNAVIIYEIVKF